MFKSFRANHMNIIRSVLQHKENTEQAFPSHRKCVCLHISLNIVAANNDKFVSQRVPCQESLQLLSMSTYLQTYTIPQPTNKAAQTNQDISAVGDKIIYNSSIRMTNIFGGQLSCHDMIGVQEGVCCWHAKYKTMTKHAKKQ